MAQIAELDFLIEKSDRLRSEGRIIVTTNGTFDLLHAGHLSMLAFAKSQGDVLIVGVNSDASCHAYKGSGRPIIACAQRMTLLAGLSCVDYVFPFEELDPRAFLERLRPDVHVNSAEYGGDCIEAETVRCNGGKVVLFPREGTISTSEILGKIQRSSIHLSSECLEACLSENFEAARKFFETNEEVILNAAETIARTFSQGNKLLICGNGGSAADAQHMAAEFVGTFSQNRSGLPAIALTADGATITAIGNDFGFDRVFARQVEAYGVPGDVLVVLTTSGNSRNLLAAVREARKRHMKVFALAGNTGGPLRELVPDMLLVPSRSTPRIQEVQILLIHSICALVERSLFPNLAATTLAGVRS